MIVECTGGATGATWSAVTMGRVPATAATARKDTTTASRRRSMMKASSVWPELRTMVRALASMERMLLIEDCRRLTDRQQERCPWGVRACAGSSTASPRSQAPSGSWHGCSGRCGVSRLASALVLCWPHGTAPNDQQGRRAGAQSVSRPRRVPHTNSCARRPGQPAGAARRGHPARAVAGVAGTVNRPTTMELLLILLLAAGLCALCVRMWGV